MAEQKALGTWSIVGLAIAFPFIYVAAALCVLGGALVEAWKEWRKPSAS